MLTTAAHGYLLSRNFTYDGGLLSKVLSEIKFTTNSNTSSIQFGSIDYVNYITNYFFKSDRQIPKFDYNSSIITDYDTTSNQSFVPTILWLTYIMVPFIFCFFISLCWIVWQAIRNHPRIQMFCYKNFTSSTNCWESSTSYDSNISMISEDDIQKKRMIFLNKNLIFSSICIILTLAYIICFVISAVSQASVQNQLTNNNNNDSLVSSWKQTSQNIDTFFNLILVDSYKIFNDSLDAMSTSIQNLLSSSLNNLTSNLMTEFRVKALFITLSNLLSNLNSTVNSMTYVTSNSQAILSDIDQLKGKLSAYQQNLNNSIPLVCNELTNKIICYQYLNESALLIVPILTSNINTESSVNMKFILQNFHLNLSVLKAEVESNELNLNGQIQKITDTKVRELNIGQSIKDVRSLWGYISSFVSPIKKNFSQTSNSISDYVQTGASIYIIISIVILILIFLIFCFSLFSIFRYFIMYYFERIILVDNMNAPSTRPIFVLHHLKKQRIINILKKDFNSPHWTIYTYLLTFSWILIFLIIISTSSVFIGEFLYHEACTQLWDPTGLQNTDKIINSFLVTNWNFINNLANTMFEIPLTFTKPSRILESIRNNCTNDTGLLHVLQWTGLINISSFVWSPQNMNTLRSGLNLTYETIIGIDTSNLMPPNMDSFLSMASNITKYFDEIDYTPTIGELSKGAIAMNNVSQWLQKSVEFFSSIKTQEATNIVRQLQNMQSELPAITNVQQKISIFRNNYIQIQERRVNNKLISQLLEGFASIKSHFVSSPSTYNTVAKAYSSIMLTNFPVQCDILLANQIQLLLGKVFPCSHLSEALVLLLNNMCNSNKTIENIVNNGLVLIVLSAFLILIFHFHWVLVRIDLSENAEKNISTC